MAKNTNSRDVTKKSFLPTLVSSGHELYSVDNETHKYTLRKSTIEQVLSSVEEKNKSLKIATVGIIGSKNHNNHKVYTDLLIQYLEHRLQTNDKIVEKFIKNFDEDRPRLSNATNGVYFWPKIYTITSKKKERCRLLILFFDGVSNRTLDILASAVCSQMYVFKEVGKNILTSELLTLRESFTKASNVTLRNPCTTVIKADIDPPRSFRMFLKDWVDFRLDFFKHKETMYNDWEQLMRYLVKTESAINSYISRTELRLISKVPVLPHGQRTKLPDKIDTVPNLKAAGPSSSHKIIGRPLPSPIPVKLTKPDPPKKPVQNGTLAFVANIKNTVQKPVPQLDGKDKTDLKKSVSYRPVSTKDLIGTIKALIYTWIAKKLNMGNINSMLDSCTDYILFDKNGLFDELAHLKYAIHSFNSEIGNMFDHHVSFQENEKESIFLQKCKNVQENLHKELFEKCPKNFDLVSYLFHHACLELKHQYVKDNELIILHETINSKRVSDEIYYVYRRVLGQNVNRYRIYEQAVKYHETLKAHCSRMLATCLDYNSRHNHVLYNESILLTKTLDNYFQLVCEGIPWTESKPNLVNNDKTMIRQNEPVKYIENEAGTELVTMKTLLFNQCESITDQLNKREVILRPLTRKVVENTIRRAQGIANDKLTTKNMLISEVNEIKELVLEYKFKKV